jgi:hypothetical protein
VDIDPTVRGARIVPEIVDTSTALGLEPGGGARSLSAGIRVVNLPNGGVLTSEQRFADTPKPFALPARLGGGFLFVAGAVLYRAETWLSPARPIFSSSTDIADVIVGLDRIYLRARNGSHQAIDPRSGKVMDLAPWPRSPLVGRYRALDGWRAVALTDLRGAVATFDAGGSWKPLALPIDPKSVEIARIDAASGEAVLASPFGTPGDFLVIGGTEADRQTPACYGLRADESTVRLPVCPADAPAESLPVASAEGPLAKLFGGRPLLAAVEDGWPIDGRTALVARDGILARVRLGDGAIASATADTFPSHASRCHPFPLLLDSGPPGLGFACGDAQGRTIIYAYDVARAELGEIQRFEPARAVLSFGNGSIAVRGSCAGEDPRAGRRFCVLSRGVESSTPRWREVALPEEAARTHPSAPSDSPESASSRLLVFGDGRIAALVPPRERLDDAHLAFLDGGRAATVPLWFDAAPPDAVRALKSGVWLDGFEEREPGMFGGWVDAAGAMLGVRVSERGEVRVGAYIRDAGSPTVSGRYGLGWGPSGRGYETTDGGMTWIAIEVPEPLSAPRERACGPIGCSAAGWIRVGWGSGKEVPAPLGLPSFRAPFHPPGDLDLVCEARDAAPPPVAADLSERLVLRLPHFLGASPFDTPHDTPGLFRTPPPKKRSEEAMIWGEADDPHLGPLARIYAWGPVDGEWARAGRWTARWLWPYGSWRDVRSASSAAAAFPTLDAARRVLGQVGSPNIVNWSMAIGDEPSSVLLFGKSLGQEITALELESDRAMVEVRRVDGEPLTQVDFAMRAVAHWYIVTPQMFGELPAAVIWRVDGATAREFARIPRVDSPPGSVRLARRNDGRAIGLVVDGEPPPDRGVPLRWVLPLDIESGMAGEAESLGAADLGDRSLVPLCVEGDAGWILDTAWSATARIAMTDGKTGSGPTGASLHNLYARERLSTGHACIERLSGTYEPEAVGNLPVPSTHARSTPASADSGAKSNVSATGDQDRSANIVVSALRSGMRYPLRCHRK